LKGEVCFKLMIE